MLICRVIGHVWATKKEEALSGQKLMVVQEECTNEKNGATFVAADSVGAGIGEQVLEMCIRDNASPPPAARLFLFQRIDPFAF